MWPFHELYKNSAKEKKKTTKRCAVCRCYTELLFRVQWWFSQEGGVIRWPVENVKRISFHLETLVVLSCWPLPGLCICLTAHQTVKWGESSLWKGCYCDNAKETFSIYSVHWRWVWQAVVMWEGGKLTRMTEEQVDGCLVDHFRFSITFRKFLL